MFASRNPEKPACPTGTLSGAKHNPNPAPATPRDRVQQLELAASTDKEHSKLSVSWDCDEG